jgi:hypothetical protein
MSSEPRDLVRCFAKSPIGFHPVRLPEAIPNDSGGRIEIHIKL